MTKTISTEEWIAAFNEAADPRTPGDSGNRSVLDLMAVAGVGRVTMQTRIAKLIALGKVEYAGKEKRPGIDTRMISVPVYRLREPKVKP
jgi:hypothetical protein